MPRDEIIPGFRIASEPEEITSLQISSTGLEKTGKTHFAMTGPAPIAYLRIAERGGTGVVDKFVLEKKVYKAEIVYPRKAAKNSYVQLWGECRRNYESALEAATKENLRTLVVDTATGAWELCRLSAFGKLTQVKPHHYGPVNAEFQGLIDSAFDAGLNVVFVHKSKKQYKNDQWSGNYERAGFGDMDFLCPVVVEHFKDKKKVKWIKVLECRYDQSLEGQQWEAEEMDFAGLAEEILPEADGSLWK